MDKLQESSGWNDYKDIKSPVEEGYPFREGFPLLVGEDDGESVRIRTFELIMKDGERQIAYVDLSRQYQAEGTQWRNASSKKVINDYFVVAWKEIEKVNK